MGQIRITLVFALAALVIIGTGEARVNATQPGVVIGQQTNVANYQHYLEDLLYTHLGQSRAFTAQHDLARDNIISTLQSFGLTVVQEPFVYQTVTYNNLVATQNGTDTPNQTIVLGAHFDSVPAGPGADDNATGTAMVMEIARVLSQHRSSKRIRYVLFDREEQGRKGSIAYVAAHGADNTVMAVTADMVGHDSGSYGMDLYGRSTSSAVVNGVGSAITTYGNGLTRVVNLGNYTFSDHWSFEQAGIPSVVIIERCYTCNANYHTANDAVDFSPTYISYTMLADLLRSVTGYMVDQTPVSLWCDADNDGDVDGADLTAFRACYGGPPAGSCFAFDKNQDNIVDCLDWPAFKTAHLASSGSTPVLDVPTFTDVLVGSNTNSADLCISDVNGDGSVDGRDVRSYLSTVLP